MINPAVLYYPARGRGIASSPREAAHGCGLVYIFTKFINYITPISSPFASECFSIHLYYYLLASEFIFPFLPLLDAGSTLFTHHTPRRNPSSSVSYRSLSLTVATTISYPLASSLTLRIPLSLSLRHFLASTPLTFASAYSSLSTLREARHSPRHIPR
jgi:hypothetical protein